MCQWINKFLLLLLVLLRYWYGLCYGIASGIILILNGILITHYYCHCRTSYYWLTDRYSMINSTA